jgi:hypothetical protein
LNDQTSGIWGDDPEADTKITHFISKRDIYSDPEYNKDPETDLMQVRKDSRGDPFKRSILGDK